MKSKSIKRLSMTMASAMFLTNAIPLLTFAVPTKDSLGSLDMNDNGDTVGVDFTQGQTTHYHEEITNEVTENTTVYVSQASSFGVIIPKTIILDGKTKNATYEVSVTGNIGGQESIEVVPEDSFLMKQQGKNDIDALVTQDKTSWIYNEFETKGNGTIVAEDMTAGSWNGQFNFNIFLNEAEPMVIAIDENGIDLNADATFILGSQKDTLLNELVDSGQIASKSEVSTLINVDTDDFDNQATATFNVSSFANVGDKVAIYHYDETTSEWEYIATCEVNDEYKITANFDSFSPVAFQVIGSEHTHTHKLVQTTATCENGGINVYECICGDRYETTVEALGHDLVAGECSRCDYMVAGLYDANGVMLCSWEDSGIDIENSDGTDESMPRYVINRTYSATKKVIVPQNITKVRESAFSNCGGVETIILPDSVEYIGPSAFESCRSLTTFEIPQKVTIIEENTFQYTSSLKSLSIPEGVTTIENNALSYSGIANLTLPSTLETIGDYAFYNSILTEVVIPNSVTSVGNSAFQYSRSLTSLTISSGLTDIGTYAFASLSNLTTLTIPEGSTLLGVDEFYNCTSLKTVSIPGTVKTISNGAFRNCVNLENITIGYGVERIETNAFVNIFNLNELEVPSSVTTIEKHAFGAVKHLIYNGPATYPEDSVYWGAQSMN